MAAVVIGAEEEHPAAGRNHALNESKRVHAAMATAGNWTAKGGACETFRTSPAVATMGSEGQDSGPYSFAVRAIVDSACAEGQLPGALRFPRSHALPDTQLIPWGRVPGMIHPLIIDVSVFMNAQATLPRKEPLRAECVEFLRRVHAAHASGRIILREPPLFVLETFAVINRQAAEHLWMLYPEWKLAPLPTTIEPFTEDDAHELMAAHAARYPTTPPYVKGADLVYLALARKHNAALVTTDDGLLRYGSDGFASVIRPSSWLVPGEAAATPQ